MNYFELHIGDLTEATAHLSMLEDGAYGRLLRKYYATEKPLPADVKQVQRLVGARSKEERDAVETVLQEFFELQDDGWHQSRCDAEIAAFHEKQAGKEGKRESAKERQRRARERRSHLFEALRGHGIVPAWTTTTAELESLLSRVTDDVTSQPVTSPVTRDNTATQTPDTRHQTPEEEIGRATSTTVGRALPGSAGAICKALRMAGIATVNPAHPTLLVLLAAGATEAEFLGAVPKAKGKRDPFGYLLGVVEGQRQDAASAARTVRSGPSPAQPESFRERDRRASAERVAAWTGGLAHDRSALPDGRPAPVAETIEGEAIERHRIAP